MFITRSFCCRPLCVLILMNCAARVTLTLPFWDLANLVLAHLFPHHVPALLLRCDMNVALSLVFAWSVEVMFVIPGGKLKRGFAPSRSSGTQRPFSRVTDLTLVHPSGILVQSLLRPQLHSLPKHLLPNWQNLLHTHTHSRARQCVPDLVSWKACRREVCDVGWWMQSVYSAPHVSLMDVDDWLGDCVSSLPSLSVSKCLYSSAFSDPCMHRITVVWFYSWPCICYA